MKIKFIKDYIAFKGVENQFAARYSYRIGKVWDVNDEQARWLIDNGFAEMATYGWLYNSGEYYTLGAYCTVSAGWGGSEVDEFRRDCGLVFKTEELAQRFVDYLKAVEVVSHDEGFMKISRKVDYSPYGYGIFHSYLGGGVISEEIDDAVKAGEFYFDTEGHAKTSIEKHPNEWQTIIDYDWSRE